MVDVTGNWVYTGGELVSYDTEPVKKTDEGYVYTQKVMTFCGKLKEKAHKTLLCRAIFSFRRYWSISGS